MFAGNRVVNEIDDAAGSADAADYDVTLDTCEVEEIGSARASGTITNTSNKAQGFEVEVRYSSPDGTLLDTASTFVSASRRTRRATGTLRQQRAS